MLLGRGEYRLAERDRLDVVAAADLRLDAIFDCAQELGHRADEGIGEPHFRPARRQPTWPLLRGEIERAWRLGGVARPTDGAAREAVGPFDAPANGDVALGTFARGAGPDVVPARGPATVVVFEDVEVDA